MYSVLLSKIHLQILIKFVVNQAKLLLSSANSRYNKCRLNTQPYTYYIHNTQPAHIVNDGFDRRGNCLVFVTRELSSRLFSIRLCGDGVRVAWLIHARLEWTDDKKFCLQTF